MLKVRIANSSEICNSRDEWNTLVKSMKLPTVFLTWEWITTWIKYFGNDYQTLVLFIIDNDELVAILPLCKKVMRSKTGFFRNRILSICGSLELYPDHLDLICQKEDNASIYIKEIIHFLTTNYKHWDIFYLASLSKEGNLAAWFSSTNLGYRVILENSILAPYISFKDDPNTFLRSMKRKKRYNLNREKKILFNKNNVNLVKVTGEEDLKLGMDELFMLHSARANDRGIKSTFSNKNIYDFHKELSQTFLNLGWLRLYFLKAGGKSIASAYGFIFNNRFYFFQTGMDPEWKKFSPGKVLIYSILQEMDDDNVIEFDFLEGDEGYKSFWTKNGRELISFKIFNSHLVSTAEFMTLKIRSYVKAILLKFHVLSIIRTLSGHKHQ